jgi:CRP-like cAMP-binding protein
MQIDLTSLHAFMLQMINLNDGAWNDMQQRLIHRNYKKRESFVDEGKVCREIAFVTKGAFRFYKMIDGVEVTTYFSFENNWISAYTSFLQQLPSYITIEAIEESEILILQYEDLQYMYQHHKIFERFGRLIAEYLVTCLDERLHSLLLKTPEERYLKTLHDNSIYFERVPQHYIASYLGIAPESLSRIRKRIMHKAIS